MRATAALVGVSMAVPLASTSFTLAASTATSSTLSSNPAAADGENDGEILGSGEEGPVQIKQPDGSWIIVSEFPPDALPVSANPQLVGILDSGVYVDHPQLKGLIVDTADFSGEGIEDQVGHGTVDAIIIVGTQRIAMPQIQTSVAGLLVAKVTRQSAEGKAVPTRDMVLQGLEWATKRGAKIINVSLGFGGDEDDPRNVEFCRKVGAYKDVLIFAAAGNSGPQIKRFPAGCGTDNILPVAASGYALSGHGDVSAPGIVHLVRQGLLSAPDPAR